MSWVEDFKGALLRYVQYYHPDAVEVTSWDEEIDLYAAESGCDTCSWGASDPYTLNIRFRDSDDGFRTFVSTTPFGELLDELIRKEEDK